MATMALSILGKAKAVIIPKARIIDGNFGELMDCAEKLWKASRNPD